MTAKSDSMEPGLYLPEPACGRVKAAQIQEKPINIETANRFFGKNGAQQSVPEQRATAHRPCAAAPGREQNRCSRLLAGFLPISLTSYELQASHVLVG